MDTVNKDTHDHVQIKYKKYSIWTIFKLAVVFMFITWLGNMFAYSTVGLNHLMSKLVGLSSDFVALCKNCLASLG